MRGPLLVGPVVSVMVAIGTLVLILFIPELSHTVEVLGALVKGLHFMEIPTATLEFTLLVKKQLIYQTKKEY